MTKLLYDIKNGVPTAEIKECKWNKRITRQEYDLKNNTVSEQRMKIIEENYSEYEILESQSLKKMDKNNNLIFEETIEKSPIDGVFNITRRNAEGSTEIICNASKSSNGNETIEKIWNPLTEQKHITDMKTTLKAIEYWIIKSLTKTANSFLNQSLTFEVKDENHFVSSRNDKKFDIKLDGNNLIVKDFQTKKQPYLNCKTSQRIPTHCLLKF